MQTKRFLTTVMVFVLMIATFAGAEEVAVKSEVTAEKIDLKLNLQKGQKFGMLITTDQKITRSMQGQEIKEAQLVTMGISNEVLDVDSEGIISIGMIYKTIKVKIEGPMGLIEFDSTKPAKDVNNPQAKMMISIYKAMIDNEIVMKISPKGSIIKIEGLDAMIDKMVGQMGAASDPNTAKAIKEMLKNFMSEGKVEQMGGSTMAAFPDGPVGIGDIWYDKIGFDFGFPMDVDTTYVLKGRKNGVVLLDVISKMDMGAEDSKLIEMNGMEMNMQMTGGMQGNMEVDEATGWMLRSKTDMRFSGVMKLAPNPQMPEGMVIPISIIGTVTVEPFEFED